MLLGARFFQIFSDFLKRTWILCRSATNFSSVKTNSFKICCCLKKQAASMHSFLLSSIKTKKMCEKVNTRRIRRKKLFQKQLEISQVYFDYFDELFDELCFHQK